MGNWGKKMVQIDPVSIQRGVNTIIFKYRQVYTFYMFRRLDGRYLLHENVVEATLMSAHRP